MRVLSSILVLAALAATAVAQDGSCTFKYNSDDDTDLCKILKDQDNTKVCYLNADNEREWTIDGDKATLEKAKFGDEECSEAEYEYDADKQEAKGSSESKSKWSNAGATQIQFLVDAEDFGQSGKCLITFDVTGGQCFGAMSAGALAGIIIGAIVGVLLIAYLIGFFLKDSCGIGFLYPCCGGAAAAK